LLRAKVRVVDKFGLKSLTMPNLVSH
jgi:hypothetical protein